MARGKSVTLTAREAEIMAVIWRLGGATAEEVRGGMAAPPHDSTIRTLLRVLETKGYVARESVGKAFRYTARVDRGKAQRAAVGSLLAQWFAGSAEDLVLRLIEDERITPEQLAELRRGTMAEGRQDQDTNATQDEGERP